MSEEAFKVIEEHGSYYLTEEGMYIRMYGCSREPSLLPNCATDYVVHKERVSINLLEDQLRLSPAQIEVVMNQAAKYEINICFLEPSKFENIVAEAQAWKKFFNDQAGPSS